MPDVKSNPKLEKARARMNIKNLESTMERQRFEIIEMEDRKERNE